MTLAPYSMMSPRRRYLHRATVPTKPIRAISRAASKNGQILVDAPEHQQGDGVDVHGVQGQDAVGQAGAAHSRQKLSTRAAAMQKKAMAMAMFSMGKSPSAGLRSAV
jgi:hypothetical protein